MDGTTIRVAVRGTPLATVGGVARIVSNAGSALVTRSGERDFVALSAICSHESCLITDREDDAFVCPCHGSKFDTGGNVLSGPAELPLLKLSPTFSDDVLVIPL